MRQEEFETGDRLVIRVYGKHGTCSGVVYTCKVISELIRTEADMKCLAWLCMN
ncbi:MAG TPA: hypothetical protein VF790_08635 [Dissulfurispiraceae bacterium]